MRKKNEKHFTRDMAIEPNTKEIGSIAMFLLKCFWFLVFGFWFLVFGFWFLVFGFFFFFWFFFFFFFFFFFGLFLLQRLIVGVADLGTSAQSNLHNLL